jgi:hypothetical protein
MEQLTPVVVVVVMEHSHNQLLMAVLVLLF